MDMRIPALLLSAAFSIGAAPYHSRHAAVQHSRHPAAQPLTPQAIEQAHVGQEQNGQAQNNNSAVIVKAEVLLDRAGFSPGVIDGHDGDNFRKAMAAFQRQRGLDPTGKLDGDTFDALTAMSEDPIIGEYEITDADVKGPFT